MGARSLLPLLLWTTPAWAECPDVAAEVDRAVESLEVLDLDRVESHLAAAEAGLGCGPAAKPTLLARMWLVEGTWRTFGGEVDLAAESFAAAHRADPDVFLEDFADSIQAPYDAAAAASTDTSTLVLRPELGDGWVIVVDGEALAMPSEVVAGLHAVQVLPAEGEGAAFAVVVLSPPGLQSSVDHSLPINPQSSGPVAPVPVPEPVSASVPEPASEPVGPATVEEPSTGARFAFHAAFGADLAFGEPQTAVRNDGVWEEPGFKPSLPIELGVGLSAGGLWLRAHLAVAPLVGGAFVWTDNGEDYYSPASFGAGATLGANLGWVRGGVLAAIARPDRVATRLVLGLDFGDLPVGAELRGGLNFVTARRAEPAVGMVITLRLGGF